MTECPKEVQSCCTRNARGFRKPGTYRKGPAAKAAGPWKARSGFVLRTGGALAQSLAAGSFRDSTRVAGTQPSLVQAMCETNADAVVAALDEALELLHDARDSLAKDRPDLTALAETGYAARVRFEARHGARGESVSPVKISSRPLLRLHPGTPGWVRQLEQAESLGGRIDIF